MPIRILPPDVQQKIAAGEVVERPASVVKELMENALDAGAQTIRVEVEEAGRRLIRVTDDGAGLAADEAALACERFATSKIQHDRDLTRVQTFGFRGEALPSIAAISRLRLLSRPLRAPLGVVVKSEGGELSPIQEAGAPVGTCVEVADLFYNTPARLQFMRSLRTEYGHIMGAFTRFALAFPEKTLSLSFDGREVYNFPSDPFQERVAACFGVETASRLETFENTGLNGRVWGFLVTQEEAWRRRYYFFVNRRAVRNATLYRVVRDTLGNDGGMVCLFVELHPSQLNVNIHPAKTEVRFRDDPSVYDLVRGGLQRRSAPRWLSAGQVAEAGVPYGEEQNTGFSLVDQVEATFLLTLSEGHLYLLDQHAAEERVLYERLQNGQVQNRSLISPQVVQLSAEEHAFFDEQAEAFAACGFSAELFGPHVLALRAIPDFLDPRMSGLTFSRLVTRVRTHKEDLHQALSCLGAIKAGQVLDREAQGHLLNAWTQTANPHACAHNRPVYFRLSLDEVRRKVGRTGLGCGFEKEGEA